METLRSVVRVNVSVGLVFVGLVAELAFIAVLGYGLYHLAHLVR